MLERNTTARFQNRLPVQIGRKKGKRRERKQVTQTAAGLDHLQLVGTQIDDIAFQVHADPEPANDLHAKLG